MKSASGRMPLRLRTVLLILSIAALATQVSGASAAAQVAAVRILAPVGIAAGTAPGASTQPNGVVVLLAGPPVSGTWALLVAGLLGGWAIGRRRVSAPGGLSLDPTRLPPR